MRKILPILLVIVIGSFVAFSIILPDFAKSVLKKKKELRLLQSEEEIMPLAQALISSKKEQISIVEQAFPKKEQLISVVQYFDSQAVAAGVLAELHFESEDVKNDRNGDVIVPVTVTIEGGYGNIIAFLDNLQKGKFFYDIQVIIGEASLGLRGKNKAIVKANLYAAN